MGSVMRAREEMVSTLDAACVDSPRCPGGGPDEPGVKNHAPGAPSPAPDAPGAQAAGDIGLSEARADCTSRCCGWRPHWSAMALGLRQEGAGVAGGSRAMGISSSRSSSPLM